MAGPTFGGAAFEEGGAGEPIFGHMLLPLGDYTNFGGVHGFVDFLSGGTLGRGKGIWVRLVIADEAVSGLEAHAGIKARGVQIITSGEGLFEFG